MATQAEGQPTGSGLAMGGILGQTARIPSTVGRLATESGLFAGLTAAEGGNLEDVLISAGVPVALGGIHAATKWTGFAKQYPKFDLAVSKRVETDRDMSHTKAREEALTAAKAYKANPDDPVAQAEWRRVTEKYGGYGSLKAEEQAPPPLTPEQQAGVKTNLAELQAQADAAKPPAPLTPEQGKNVTATLAELESQVKPAPPADTPLSPVTQSTQVPPTVTTAAADSQTTPTPAQNTPLVQKPWEMTKETFLSRNHGDPDEIIAWHKGFIEKALSEGKPVPPEVLAEYPELQTPQPKGTPDGKVQGQAEAQGPIAPVSEPTAAGGKEAPAPVAEKQPWTISGRNADLDEHAKRMGLDGVNTKEKQTMRGWLAESRKQGIPEKSTDLATEIIAGGRPLPDVPLEVVQAGMEDRLGRLSLEYDTLREKRDTTTDAAEKMSMDAEMTRTRSEFDLVKKGHEMIGTTAGRTLVGRKMTLDENLNLVSILNQADTSRGPKKGPLNEQQQQQYAKMVEERNAAMKERDEMRTKVSEMEAFAHAKEGGKKRTGRKMPEARAKERKALTDQIRVLLKAGCY